MRSGTVSLTARTVVFPSAARAMVAGSAGGGGPSYAKGSARSATGVAPLGPSPWPAPADAGHEAAHHASSQMAVRCFILGSVRRRYFTAVASEPKQPVDLDDQRAVLQAGETRAQRVAALVVDDEEL